MHTSQHESSSNACTIPLPSLLMAQATVLISKRLCCDPCPLQAQVRRVLQPLKASPHSGTAELQDLFIFLSNAVHSSKLRGVLMKEVGGWVGGWVHQSAGHAGRWHLYGTATRPALPFCFHNCPHTALIPSTAPTQGLPAMLAHVLTPEAVQQHTLTWHEHAMALANTLLNVESRWAGGAAAAHVRCNPQTRAALTVPACFVNQELPGIPAGCFPVIAATTLASHAAARLASTVLRLHATCGPCWTAACPPRRQPTWLRGRSWTHLGSYAWCSA